VPKTAHHVRDLKAQGRVTCDRRHSRTKYRKAAQGAVLDCIGWPGFDPKKVMERKIRFMKM